jgi:hypothetical protein
MTFIAATALAGLVACGGGEDAAKPDDSAKDAPAKTRQAVADQILSALVVIDAVDSAAFHDMAKALAEASEVNTRFATTTSNVIAAVKKGSLAPELQAVTAKLTADLTRLETALKAGDLAGARDASEAVHDSQHDFSKGVYTWLAARAGELGDDAEDIVLGSMAAIDLIDAAGFHDMAKAMAQATEVNARDATTVANVLAATRATTWPEALKAEQVKFVADAETLKRSIDGKDLAAARTAAEAIHDSQHDLSKGFYAWLGKQPRLTHAAGVLHADLCALKVTDMVESAGFHDMAKTLAESEEINARFAGQVDNTLRTMMVMTWSAGDSAAAAKLAETMQNLHQALAAGDLARARTYAEAVHDAQHDFSKGVYGRMMMMGHN